ncbi:hypothetical protein D0S45_19195 [Marinifilum sp. JC120]|nr:hypothetical protein D0S45_19195 [Marinifilum sp. JC120]
MNISKKVSVFGVLFLMVLFCLPANAEVKGKVDNGQKQLLKMSTLSSVEANQEFQRNVQIMQLQRQRVIQLQTQLEQAQTKELKKSLKKELKAATKKLNENNELMVKTYGFSLNRNYVLVVEKAHIYLELSPEEAKKMEKDKKKAKKK